MNERHKNENNNILLNNNTLLNNNIDIDNIDHNIDHNLDNKKNLLTGFFGRFFYFGGL